MASTASSNASFSSNRRAGMPPLQPKGITLAKKRRAAVAKEVASSRVKIASCVYQLAGPTDFVQNNSFK